MRALLLCAALAACANHARGVADATFGGTAKCWLVAKAGVWLP